GYGLYSGYGYPAYSYGGYGYRYGGNYYPAYSYGGYGYPAYSYGGYYRPRLYGGYLGYRVARRGLDYCARRGFILRVRFGAHPGTTFSSRLRPHFNIHAAEPLPQV